MADRNVLRGIKQDLGFGDYEVERSPSAERHWHMVMLPYSLLRLGPVRGADNS